MRLTSTLTFLVIVLLAAGSAPAQTQTTDVEGKILQCSSKPYPAVYVPITLNSTQLGRSTRVYTDTDGRYYFHGVPRGVYTLEVWVEENLPSTFPIQVSSQPLTRVPDEFELNLALIESVLANSKSSDRLLLGAVSALNKMNCPYTLSSTASVAIIKLGAYADSAIRAAVIRYVEFHPSWDLVSQFESVLAEARKQVAPGATSFQVSALALTGLQLFYNVGISEKDQYGSRKPEDRPRVNKAIEAFAKGWNLRSLSSAKDRIVYPKALYGWGLALHDRSWIERRQDKSRDPVLVKAAQDKFAEFLREVDAAGGRKAYPIPGQLTKASAYIRNPVPGSLR